MAVFNVSALDIAKEAASNPAHSSAFGHIVPVSVLRALIAEHERILASLPTQPNRSE